MECGRRAVGVENELWSIHQHLGIVGDEINLTLSFIHGVTCLARSQQLSCLGRSNSAPAAEWNVVFCGSISRGLSVVFGHTEPQRCPPAECGCVLHDHTGRAGDVLLLTGSPLGCSPRPDWHSSYGRKYVCNNRGLVRTEML